MPLFRKAPPPKKPRRSHIPDTLDKALEKELIRRARRDPEWAFKAAKHKFGLMLPEETEDPVEKVQRQALAEALENDPDFIEQVKQQYLQERGMGLEGDELERRIAEAASDEIERNPELLAKAVRHRIDSVLSSRSSDGVSDLLQQLRDLKDLEEEMGGGKKEGIGGLIDSKVITEIVKILPSLLGHPPPSGVYIVETTDGRTLQLSAEEYGQYKQRKALLPPSEGRAVEEHPTESSPTGSQGGDLSQELQVEVPAELQGNLIDPQEWLPYLEKEPAEFAQRLLAVAERSDEVGQAARFTLTLLRSKSPDELLQLLARFKEEEKYRMAIEKLEAKKEWLEGLVAHLQGEVLA